MILKPGKNKIGDSFTFFQVLFDGEESKLSPIFVSAFKTTIARIL